MFASHIFMKVCAMPPYCPEIERGLLLMYSLKSHQDFWQISRNLYIRYLGTETSNDTPTANRKSAGLKLGGLDWMAESLEVGLMKPPIFWGVKFRWLAS